MEDNLNNSAVVTFSPNLEKMLDQKIGYGKGQYKLCIPLAFLMIC